MANKRISDLSSANCITGSEKLIVDQESSASISGLVTVAATTSALKTFTLSAADSLEVCGPTELKGGTVVTGGLNATDITVSSIFDTSAQGAILSGGRDLSTIFGSAEGGGTLQSVTNQGNVTTNSILVRNNSCVRDVLSAGQVLVAGEEKNILEPNRSNIHIIGGRENYIDGTNSLAIGSSGSRVTGDMAFIAGGGSLSATAQHTTIVGGLSNVAFGFNSSVFGGRENNADSLATIVGGFSGLTKGKSTTLVGGVCNISCSLEGVVVGGYKNIADNYFDSGSNISRVQYASVIGGKNNNVRSSYGAILGGTFNRSLSSNSVIVGGTSNVVEGVNSAAIGSSDTKILSGFNTTIIGSVSSVMQGCSDSTSNAKGVLSGSAIIGGHFSQIFRSPNSTIIGSVSSFIDQHPSAACDERPNSVINTKCARIRNSSGSTIIAGEDACLDDTHKSIIIGGFRNKIESGGDCGFVIGGAGNSNAGENSGILGSCNSIVCNQGLNSVIVGGRSNIVYDGDNSFIGAGCASVICSDGSAIIGGKENHTCAQNSLVLGMTAAQVTGGPSGVEGINTVFVSNLSAAELVDTESLSAAGGGFLNAFSGNVAGCSTITVKNGIIVSAS